MYTKILIPVDGSETSNRALEHAVSLASVCGAEVCLLHIVDPLLYANGFERSEIYVNQVLPAMLRAGYRTLANARKVVERLGVPCVSHLAQCGERRVSEIIVAYAVSWSADVIVMGTHGRRGISRFLMGSDAESVVRTSFKPVLLIRSTESVST